MDTKENLSKSNKNMKDCTKFNLVNCIKFIWVIFLWIWFSLRYGSRDPHCNILGPNQFRHQVGISNRVWVSTGTRLRIQTWAGPGLHGHGRSIRVDDGRKFLDLPLTLWTDSDGGPWYWLKWRTEGRRRTVGRGPSVEAWYRGWVDRSRPKWPGRGVS